MEAAAALAPLRREPQRTAVLTDFDGSLAEIVRDPAQARPVPGAADVLGRLAGRYGRVAVISGRPVSFLTPLLPPTVVLSGLYGLETVRNGLYEVREGLEGWREAVAKATEASQTRGPGGMAVEPKGLSLTLHYRGEPGTRDAVEAWARSLATEHGLHVRAARMSVELHPPVDLDKGTAVREQVGDLASACFVGDDLGDLPAFAALDALRAEGRTVVKVGVHSTEAPPALLEQADCVVDGPVAALAALASLL